MAETGIVRQPRAFLNGITLEEVEVHLVRGQPASFEAVMALDDPSNPGAGYWSSVGEAGATVTIDAGDGSGAQTVFSGHFTRTEVNFADRTVRAEGKDTGDQMIATRNDQAYVNQPVSAVVSQIAGKHGLGANTTGAGGMAGHTYDHQEYRYNTDVQNDWDAIQDMAYQVGNVFWVDGVENILHFVDPQFVDGNYNITYVPPTKESYDSSNVAIHLLCSHDCTLQGGASTLSDSMFSFDNKTYTGTAGGGGGGGSVSGGSKQFYHEAPGRTQDQVETQAQGDKNLADSKQWVIDVTAPGNTSVKASTGVTLSGTGSAWDQLYATKSVTHKVSAHEGYLMNIVGNAGAGSGGGGDSGLPGSEPSTPSQEGVPGLPGASPPPT